MNQKIATTKLASPETSRSFAEQLKMPPKEQKLRIDLCFYLVSIVLNLDS